MQKALGILGDHNRVRMMIWIGGLLALATSLDSSLCGGLYTRGTMRMFPIWLPASDFTEPRAKPDEGMDVISLREAALNPIPVR